MEKIKKEITLFGKFSLVGVVSFALGCTIISTLMFAGLSPQISNAISYSIGFFLSFFLRKKFVFQSSKKVVPEFLKFIITFGFAYVVNWIILTTLLSLQLNPYICQFLAMISYVVSSYALFRNWVFN